MGHTSTRKELIRQFKKMMKAKRKKSGVEKGIAQGPEGKIIDENKS